MATDYPQFMEGCMEALYTSDNPQDAIELLEVVFMPYRKLQRDRVRTHYSDPDHSFEQATGMDDLRGNRLQGRPEPVPENPF